MVALGNDTPVVTQIDPPPEVRILSTLSSVDYADAFLVQGDGLPDWSARRWAGAVLEEPSAEMRAKLSSGWAALGLKSVTTADSVSGWAVRRADTDSLVIGRRSRIGMPGELLFATRPDGLVFATFIRHRSAVTRSLWAAVRAGHVHTVQALLERAACAAADEVRGSAGTK